MAEVTVRVPSSLRAKIGGADALAGRGDTVAQILRHAEAQAPDLSPLLRNEQGAFRAGLQVYVNDEHVRYRQGVQTRLQDGDTVLVVPTIMGG